jgi:hypothetical protein
MVLSYNEQFANIGLEHFKLIELTHKVLLSNIVWTDVSARNHERGKAVLYFIRNNLLADARTQSNKVFLRSRVVAKLVVDHHTRHHVKKQECILLKLI